MTAIISLGRKAAPAVIDRPLYNADAQRIINVSKNIVVKALCHLTDCVEKQLSIIIGYKDILLVIIARKNVIKCTFIFNSPWMACRAIAYVMGGAMRFS